jgi:hypothetical protein
MHIKFKYLYRDASNYKSFGEIVFTNPSGLTIDKITNLIQNNLIDGEWFVPTEWSIPRLHFQQYTWDADIDHEWHEFQSVEYSSDSITETRTIDEFMINISKR